jgi:hypothetical protein
MGSHRLMTSPMQRVVVERFAATGTRIEIHLCDTPDADALVTALRGVVEAVDNALTVHRVSPTTILNDRLQSEGVADVAAVRCAVRGHRRPVRSHRRDGRRTPTCD